MGNDEGRLLDGFDELGHRKSLARTGRTQEDLRPLTVLYALRQGRYGRRLIARHSVRRFYAERPGCIIIFITFFHIHNNLCSLNS